MKNINLQELSEFVLHFVNNKIPLKTRHLRANQAPYMTKDFRKATMTRSSLKNIYLKKKGTRG